MSKNPKLTDYIYKMIDNPNKNNAEAHATALTMVALQKLGEKLGYDILVGESDQGIPHIVLEPRVIDYMKENKDK